MDSIADGQGIGVRRDFLRAGESMESAQDDQGTALAVPASQLVCALGKGEMDGDADDLGKGIEGGRSLQQVYIAILDGPRFRRGGEAG